MPKSVKVAKVGLKREPGFLYFIDKDGDVSKVKMNRGGKKKAAKKPVKKAAPKKKAVKKKAVKKAAPKKKAAKKPAKKKR